MMGNISTAIYVVIFVIFLQLIIYLSVKFMFNSCTIMVNNLARILQNVSASKH